jgi:hypothetical protein
MRALGFIFFLAASICGWYSLTRTQLSNVELEFLRSRDYAATTVTPIPLSLLASELRASEAKNLRRTTLAASATAAAFFFFLGFVALAKHRSWQTFSTTPDFDTLLDSIKKEPWRSRPPLTHFYESRRARCRAARSRLKPQIEQVFAVSESAVPPS